MTYGALRTGEYAGDVLQSCTHHEEREESGRDHGEGETAIRGTHDATRDHARTGSNTPLKYSAQPSETR
jgi:hypothetical protein